MNFYNEIAQDDIEMKIEALTVVEIESDSPLFFEAAGTEATLKTATAFDAVFKEKLLEAVKCKGSNAQSVADKELGEHLRELVTNYIAGDVRDLWEDLS